MRVEIARRAEKDPLRLDQKICTRILDALSGFEQEPPAGDVKKLKRKNSEPWQLRVGDLYVIFRIDTEKEVVFVLHIGHRREVYR